MRKNVWTLALLTGSVALGGFAGGYGERCIPCLTPKRPQAAAPVRVAAVGLLPEQIPSPQTMRGVDPNDDTPVLETYENALETIHQRYYGTLPKSPEYTTDQVLTYAAIRGMLTPLNDRYTRFLTPGEYREMMEDNRGEFSGIGAQLDANSKQVIIVDTIDGSPARKAGLKAGDRIIKVDNTTLGAINVDDAVKLIRGERGTAVRLTVVRKGAPRPLLFSVVRDIVEYDNVKTDVLPGNIGYMQLASFNDQSDRRVERALGQLQAKNIKGLIFDLRWNPGGLLEQAVAITSRLIPEGPVVWIKERGGKPESMDVMPVKRRLGRIPLVILINKYSASASEIVAGAVKDTRSGTLVGTTTWGKGLVQTINPIATDQSAVLITTHRYYTPAMVDINKKGIAPDVVVEVKDEDFVKYRTTRKIGDDPQVRRALEVMQGQMGAQAAAPHGLPALAAVASGERPAPLLCFTADARTVVLA